MKLRRLAEILVDAETCDLSGSEYLTQVDAKIKKLRESVKTDANDITTVKVEINDYD